MPKRILIIKHVEIEGAGTLEKFFKNIDRETATLDFAAGGFPPDNLDGIGAIVSMGGPMNVYEESEYHFLKEEDLLLKEALKKELPILGICLGAQLLAKACGAKVKKARQKEVGWYEIVLSEDGRKDPLFENLPGEMRVFQWHEDTFDIPSGAVRLAGSGSCINQAFRFGRNAYALQFHVEVTPDIIESWVNVYLKEGKELINAENMMTEAYKNRKTFEKQAEVIYSNFMKIIGNS